MLGKRNYSEVRGKLIFALFGVLLLVLSTACSPEIQEDQPPTKEVTTSISPSSTPLASATITPTLAPSGPAPAAFTSDIIREENTVQRYIVDECQYLAKRWDPKNALPGTIVAPIMFHSIRPGNEEINDPSFINADTFFQIMELAEFFGFETISSEELIGFLYRNERIPQRSMILILDDRRPGTAEDYFLPVMEENDWISTLAWLVGDTDRRTGLWDWIERLNDTGYFDIQSHGFNHIYLNEDMSKEEVTEEITALIPIFEERFGYRPLVYIWPGGNYTEEGIRIARNAGYKLGFTVHSRGPIQFNWIPQGEKELSFGDPLMTLPRFWSSAAVFNLDQAVKISDSAIEHSVQNYPEEADWYSANCAGELPAFPEVISGLEN